MTLIKYCKKKYHIKNLDYIQIGTMNYYRNSNTARSDVNEGKLKRVEFFASRPMNIPEKLAGILTGGMIKVTSDNFVEMGKKSRFILDFNVDLPNCYIFCCSHEKIYAQDQRKRYFNCDTSYRINNIEEFKRKISKSIIEKLGSEYSIVPP